MEKRIFRLPLISKTGSRDLPWDLECITGYNIIEAEDLDEADARDVRQKLHRNIRPGQQSDADRRRGAPGLPDARNRRESTVQPGSIHHAGPLPGNRDP